MSMRSRSLVPNIWPGFVDALATLLMVLVFLLVMFVLSQFVLNGALFERDRSLAALSEELNLQRVKGENLSSEILVLRNELEEKGEALSSSRSLILSLRSDLSRQEELTSIESRKLSKSASDLAILNNNILALRSSLDDLNSALEASERLNVEREFEIVELGQKLNAALARRAQELVRYRSEFFGKLSEVLVNRDDIEVVGDRFVFRSEVLFAEADAELTQAGRDQLRSVSSAILEIGTRIPDEIDWVLRVDGHTDSRPISNALYASNWELSSARSISVIRFFISQGVPAIRLVAAGFGEHRPLDLGSDELSYSRNRRIELKLTHR